MLITKEQWEAIKEHDRLYTAMFTAVVDFYRFEKRNPEMVKCDLPYYTRVADVLQRRIALELKYVKSPFPE